MEYNTVAQNRIIERPSRGKVYLRVSQASCPVLCDKLNREQLISWEPLHGRYLNAPSSADIGGGGAGEEVTGAGGGGGAARDQVSRERAGGGGGGTLDRGAAGGGAAVTVCEVKLQTLRVAIGEGME